MGGGSDCCSPSDAPKEGLRVMIRYLDKNDKATVEDLKSYLIKQVEADRLNIVVKKQISSSKDDDDLLRLEILLGGRKGERIYSSRNTSGPISIDEDDKESILEDIQDALAEQNWIDVQKQRKRPPQ